MVSTDSDLTTKRATPACTITCLHFAFGALTSMALCACRFGVGVSSVGILQPRDTHELQRLSLHLPSANGHLRLQMGAGSFEQLQLDNRLLGYLVSGCATNQQTSAFAAFTACTFVRSRVCLRGRLIIRWVDRPVTYLLS